MTAALPTVGASAGTWGTLLNAWLLVAHNTDGTLLPVLTQSATAQALTGTPTITTASLGAARVSETANITGAVLQAGTAAGQGVTVVNESAFTITFAAAGTSNVADGTADVIPALTARSFTWDAGTSLWYRLA